MMQKQKTTTAQDLIIQAWWNDTLIYSNHFFDMTASFRFDALEHDVMLLYYELQMIRTSYEQADYPLMATDARRHLLNSMSKVMVGFQQFVAGNIDIAQKYMTTARRDLRSLENELSRLGIPSWYGDLPLH